MARLATLQQLVQVEELLSNNKMDRDKMDHDKMTQRHSAANSKSKYINKKSDTHGALSALRRNLGLPKTEASTKCSIVKLKHI